MNVIVFGATGNQGRAQVQELIRQRYRVKAASRYLALLNHPDFLGVEPVQADYEDSTALEAALVGVDAIFFQAPAMGNVDRVIRYAENLRRAADSAGVKMIIVNSSMWAPDSPIGQATFDGVLAMEETFRQGRLPVTIFRPTLFMDNFLGAWMKPNIIKGVYRYAQKMDFEADWIALKDVAKFMVAALDRPDLADRKIHIGGPERISTRDVIEILSAVSGRQLRYEYISPRQMGETVYSLWGPTTGVEHAKFVDEFDSFYTFGNEAPQKPFQADVERALRDIPLTLTNLRSWALAQVWS